MASAGPNPQQIAAMQQQFAAEAAKRGLTPEQFAKQQRDQLAADAAKQGLTPEQYVAQLRMRAMQQMQAQRLAAQQAQTQAQAQSPELQAQQQSQALRQQPQGQAPQATQQVSVNPSNPPDPKAVAVAKWLRSQNLKTRTCILDGQRRDMFKGEQNYN